MCPIVPMALVAPDSIRILPGPVFGKVLVAETGWLVVAACTAGATLTVADADALAVVAGRYAGWLG